MLLMRSRRRDVRRARELRQRRARHRNDLRLKRETEGKNKGQGPADHWFDILVHAAYISKRWSDLGPLATSLKKAKSPPFEFDFFRQAPPLSAWGFLFMERQQTADSGQQNQAAVPAVRCLLSAV
jgi:hypothetical protein